TCRVLDSIQVKRTLVCLLLVAGSLAAGKSEVLWERYGAPHIFAADREAMFYAHVWAQAQAQGNLLLLLYGESRGRAAEYWGGGSGGVRQRQSYADHPSASCVG